MIARACSRLGEGNHSDARDDNPGRHRLLRKLPTRHFMSRGSYMAPKALSRRTAKIVSAPNPTRDASPWTPFEDRRRARDEKRDAVLRMAVRLFLEEGYHRTPLARIAERLNITSPPSTIISPARKKSCTRSIRLGRRAVRGKLWTHRARRADTGLHKLNAK